MVNYWDGRTKGGSYEPSFAAEQGYSRSPRTADRIQNTEDRFHRGRCGGEEKGSRSAAGVIGANSTKRVFGCLHRVAATGAMHVPIHETGSEIISLEIDDVLFADVPGLAQLGDFAFRYDNFQAVADFGRKNQARVGEDHLTGRQLRLPARKSIFHL